MSTALVLDANGPPPKELLTALAAECETVEVMTPDAVLSTLDIWLKSVEVVLAPATIPPSTVKLVNETLVGLGAAPAVIIYADDDIASLEQHVQQGFDYIMPPFLEGLVRARIRACRDGASSTERELQIGREIQQGFLPESVPLTDGWDVGIRFLPARQVAGDFYDVFELVNRRRLALIVADVCDKGVGAALFMALIRSLLRYSAEHSGLQSLLTAHYGGIPMVGATPLMDAVSGTNEYLTRNHLQQAYFATLFFGVLDPASGKLIYINGGHNPPLLMRAYGGPPETLDPTGPAVGVLPGGDFGLGYAQLELGDTLFVYTDGVTEARDEVGAFLGDQRLRDALSVPADSADELVTRVEALLRAHTGKAEQSDDITMLALHRRH